MPTDTSAADTHRLPHCSPPRVILSNSHMLLQPASTCDTCHAPWPGASHMRACDPRTHEKRETHCGHPWESCNPEAPHTLPMSLQTLCISSDVSSILHMQSLCRHGLHHALYAAAGVQRAAWVPHRPPVVPAVGEQRRSGDTLLCGAGGTQHKLRKVSWVRIRPGAQCTPAGGQCLCLRAMHGIVPPPSYCWAIVANTYCHVVSQHFLPCLQTPITAATPDLLPFPPDHDRLRPMRSPWHILYPPPTPLPPLLSPPSLCVTHCPLHSECTRYHSPHLFPG